MLLKLLREPLVISILIYKRLSKIKFCSAKIRAYKKVKRLQTKINLTKYPKLKLKNLKYLITYTLPNFKNRHDNTFLYRQ